MSMRLDKSKVSSIVLNLLMPGLGHIYWKEYIFGIFVFLVVLIGMILFFVSFFTDLSKPAIIGMLSLPVIFYMFTFVDLLKTKKQKSSSVNRLPRTIYFYFLVGFVFQVVAPITPTNFMLRNFPEYFIIEQNNLSPIFHQGDLVKSDKLAYIINIFFIEKPILKDLPDRYDLVRFVQENGQREVGMVLAFPNEEFELTQGVVVVNGIPDPSLPPGNLMFTGDIELTPINEYSILVATLNLGTIDRVYQISLSDLVGKVEKVF